MRLKIGVSLLVVLGILGMEASAAKRYYRRRDVAYGGGQKRKAARSTSKQVPTHQANNSDPAEKCTIMSHYSPSDLDSGGDCDAMGNKISSYMKEKLTIAHKTLPFCTLVEIRTRDGHTAVAMVTDRGPFFPGRNIDSGPATSEVLMQDKKSVQNVCYKVVGKETDPEKCHRATPEEEKANGCDKKGKGGGRRRR